MPDSSSLLLANEIATVSPSPCRGDAQSDENEPPPIVLGAAERDRCRVGGKVVCFGKYEASMRSRRERLWKRLYTQDQQIVVCVDGRVLHLESLVWDVVLTLESDGLQRRVGWGVGKITATRLEDQAEMTRLRALAEVQGCLALLRV